MTVRLAEESQWHMVRNLLLAPKLFRRKKGGDEDLKKSKENNNSLVANCSRLFAAYIC